MIFTLDEIIEKSKLIVEKYDVEFLYLFGDYAEGVADEKSRINMVYRASEKDDYHVALNFEGDLADEFVNHVEIWSESVFLNNKNPLTEHARKRFKERHILIYKNET